MMATGFTVRISVSRMSVLIICLMTAAPLLAMARLPIPFSEPSRYVRPAKVAPAADLTTVIGCPVALNTSSSVPTGKTGSCSRSPGSVVGGVPVRVQ